MSHVRSQAGAAEASKAWVELGCILVLFIGLQCALYVLLGNMPPALLSQWLLRQ